MADVELVEALGNELQVHFLIDATKARSEVTAAAPETEELGDLASLQMGEAKAEGVARISPRSDFRAGSRVTFVVAHRTAPLLRPRHRPSDLGLSRARGLISDEPPSTARAIVVGGVDAGPVDVGAVDVGTGD